MNPGIEESDWKRFKKLRATALDRMYESILADAQHITQSQSGTSQDKYVELYQMIRAKDKEISSVFDGLSRSRALHQLAHIRAIDLITDEELSGFSENTLKSVYAAVGPHS